jgi:hypothetical protein
MATSGDGSNQKAGAAEFFRPNVPLRADRWIVVILTGPFIFFALS